MKQELFFVCEVCGELDKDESYIARHEKACTETKEREVAARKRREEFGQLTIGQIIKKCQGLPNLPIRIRCIRNDEQNPSSDYSGMCPYDTDSYRGYYDELSLNPIDPNKEEVDLNRFVKMMEDSLGRAYYGYRGGEYYMYKDTFVWLSEYGESSGFAVTDIQLPESNECIFIIAKLMR